MTSEGKEQLQSYAFGGFISGVIGALVSVITVIVISPQSQIVRILALLGGASILIGFTIYFIAVSRRSRRILDRLGIIDVIERSLKTKGKTNKECDWPTEAAIHYKFCGLSAVNVLTHECISRIMKNSIPAKLEILHLDPACETAIRRMAIHESHEPDKVTTAQELKMNISIMLTMANLVRKRLNVPEITLVRHPFVPTFRVSIIDDDLMYLGEYLPGSCGFFSDLIMLQNLGEKPSLFRTFQRYYERTRMSALMHLVARTAICEKFSNRRATASEIRAKVVSALQPEVENAHNLVTIQLVEDIFREYGLDSVQGDQAVQ